MYFLYSPLSSLPQSPPSHSMFVAKLLIQYLTFTLLYLENIHPSFTQTPPFLNNNCFPNGVNLIPICSLYLAIFLPQLYHGLCHICRNSFHMRTPPPSELCFHYLQSCCGLDPMFPTYLWNYFLGSMSGLPFLHCYLVSMSVSFFTLSFS